MNLIELSKQTNQSIEFLKNEILEKFGKIVLSEYNAVHESIAEYFINEYSASQQNKTEYIKGTEDKSTSIQDNKVLEELIDIQHPEIAITKKLLSYCMENKYFIFIDTCSLLNDNFMDFYNLFLQQNKETHTVLYVPYVVTEELKKIAVEKKKEKEVTDKAIRMLRFIQVEEDKNNLVRVGNESDKRANERGEKVIHADRVIIEKLIFFRNDSRSSLFITQDFDATVDALKQNDWHSSKSSAFILVKKIIKGGALVDNTKETVNPKLPIDN